MRKFLLFLLLAGLPALGQNTNTFGNITTGASTCGAANCVFYQLPPNTPYVVVTVAGTWTGTVNFQSISAPNANYSNLNSVAWTKVATETADGNWSVATGGATYLLIQAAAGFSGSAAVAMSASQTGSPLNNPVFPGGVTGTGLTAANGGGLECWLTNGTSGGCGSAGSCTASDPYWNAYTGECAGVTGTGNIVLQSSPTIDENLYLFGDGNANLQLTNYTAATSGQNQDSPIQLFISQFWDGTKTTANGWSEVVTNGAGANPTTTFAISHYTGTTGFAAVSVPNLQIPGAEAANGTNCLQIDTTGNVTKTGTICAVPPLNSINESGPFDMTGDAVGIYNYTGPAATASLPDSLSEGFTATFVNNGSGALTLYGNGITLNCTPSCAIPAGSSALVYTDGTDYYAFTPPNSGGGSSPLTTKGDVYGYSTAGARVPVGANGTVLGADSTQALGVAYKDMPSVLITDPPYNAACDGSTDDSTAIQAAINSGKVVNFPLSTSADLIQCNYATTLTIPANGNVAINGNGSELDYTGTTTAIDATAGPNLEIDNLQLQLQNGTASTTGIAYDGGSIYDDLLLNNDSICTGTGCGATAVDDLAINVELGNVYTSNLLRDGDEEIGSNAPGNGSLFDVGTTYYGNSGGGTAYEFNPGSAVAISNFADESYCNNVDFDFLQVAGVVASVTGSICNQTGNTAFRFESGSFVTVNANVVSTGSSSGGALYSGLFAGIILYNGACLGGTGCPAAASTTNASSVTVSQLATNTYYNNQQATGSVAYHLPTLSITLTAQKYCFTNSYDGSGAAAASIEIYAGGSDQIIFTDGTLSAAGGYVSATGAAGVSGCVVAIGTTSGSPAAPTYWQFTSVSGSWTKH